jgi:hypothetical protein
MKRFFILTLILLISAALKAQRDSLSVNDIAPFAYSFHLHNGLLTGQGGDTLRAAIEGSQFFLLGEYHGDKGISLLTEALLSELAKEGYNHFGLEVGPFSADQLNSLLQTDDPTASFSAFYTEQTALTGEVPIPFFEHHEDIAFLKKAGNLGYDFWGLDQEFLGGYLFLLDELWQEANQPGSLQDAYDSARKRIVEYYKMSHEPDAYEGSAEALEVYNLLLNDTDFLSLCHQLGTRIEDGNERVKAMKESFLIYRNWRADRLANLEGRSKIMKRYFLQQYHAANQPFPKVMVKMGGIHTSRGFTQNASYELGNMLSELAQMNGKHSVHLSFATRYYYDPEKPDSVGDNLTYRNDWMNAMRPLLLHAKTDQWTLIDLQAVRRVWINERKYVGAALRTLLESHDFIVLMPPFPDPTPHFNLNLIRD